VLASAIEELEGALDRAIELAAAGDRKAARSRVGDIYFEIFEGKGIETALAVHDPGEKTRIESLFAKLRSEIKRGGTDQRLRAICANITSSSRQLLLARKPSGGMALFVQAFLILFREGAEAILIIAALAAYLAKTGNTEKNRWLYGSAASGLAASCLLAFIIFRFFGAAIESNEILEGASMLLAALVLCYVSNWLFSHARAQVWQQFLAKNMATALTRGSLGALALTAFLAVFREGAETVLFYQALLASTGGRSLPTILSGILAAALALLLVFVAVRTLGVQIPYRPFFLVTGSLLYLLAFSFAGQGVLELQNGKLIPTTSLPGIPEIPMLGIHPYLESVLLQSLLLLLAAVALVRHLRPGRPSNGPPVAAAVVTLFCLVSTTALAGAPFREYPIGDSQSRAGMKFVAVYLPPIQVDKEEIIPREGKERIHLECDVHAIRGNKNGFGIGEFIPYLTVHYRLTRLDSKKTIEGLFAPMVAKDGPHYGATIRMLGKGTYKVEYEVRNPGENGFGRHTDPVTGVGPWFEPFTLTWTFDYEGAPTFDAVE